MLTINSSSDSTTQTQHSRGLRQVGFVIFHHLHLLLLFLPRSDVPTWEDARPLACWLEIAGENRRVNIS